MRTGMWSKRSTHTLLVGMQNGTTALEDSFVFLQD